MRKSEPIPQYLIDQTVEQGVCESWFRFLTKKRRKPLTYRDLVRHSRYGAPMAVHRLMTYDYIYRSPDSAESVTYQLLRELYNVGVQDGRAYERGKK